jgi:NMD protein affecting ribosome stability and mRNA decay
MFDWLWKMHILHTWTFETLSRGMVKRGVVRIRVCSRCGKRQIRKYWSTTWFTTRRGNVERVSELYHDDGN